ncbi:MAG: hypothetical protein K6A35_00985 [bacterium]|nr:hypothetical protein [bacterium]
MQELHMESQELTLDDGRKLVIRMGRLEDLDRIRKLYTDIYGNAYTIPEIADPAKTSKALTSPCNYLWIVCEHEKRIVGSVIFAVDPYHHLGEAFGGAIASDFRGCKLIYSMMKRGHSCLLYKDGPCTLIYAMVRTFVSTNFHKHLKELGYIDLGIFPNVRKVRYYETHSFKICPGPDAFKNRRPLPRIFSQVQTMYRLVDKQLKLGQAIMRSLQLPPSTEPLIHLNPADPSDYPNGIEAEREKLRQAGKLRFGFFPLLEPNVMLINEDKTVRAFFNFQELDGHATMVGLETGTHDMVCLLESVASACERMQAKYLEVLASAYDPMIQAQLWKASFLPCAWFPAARLDNGQRLDYMFASRSFVPLNFKGLKLTEDNKPYLLEFFKLYNARLWEELVDA